MPAQTSEQISRIARQTAKLIGAARELTDDDIPLDERYHAGAYGIPGWRDPDAITRTAPCSPEPALYPSGIRPTAGPRDHIHVYSGERSVRQQSMGAISETV